MTGLAEMLALVALVPAMTGPVGGQAADHNPIVALCGGGTLAIPFDGQPAPGPATAPCCAKGCHSRDRRRTIDRKQ